MYELCGKIKNLSPYEPLKGDYKVRLDANESYIALPENITEEIKQGISGIKFNRYPDPYAVNACGAFANYYGIDKKYVTAGNGSDELISVIVNGFFIKGDKVVITSPDFSMYNFYCHISEISTFILGKTDLVITADEIIAAVKNNKAKGLILSNPCNPTSCGIKKQDILKLVQALSDTLVIIDEAYMDFAEESVLNAVNSYDNLVILKTCSKNFGLAAIRLGFAVAGEKITNALRAVKSPYNVNSLTALAGSIVLSHSDYLKGCTKKIIKQRIKLYNKLTEIKGCFTVTESCTNFVFVHIQNAESVYKTLLDKGVAVRNLGSYLRITAGSDEENDLFIKAFKEAL